MIEYPRAIANGWFPVASLSELRDKPLSRRLLGTPIVMFRASGGPAVFIDRCPHRNMPLSLGRMRGGSIECPYHGWRFGVDGKCTDTPGVDQPARQSAEVLPVILRAGLIWTTMAREPAVFPPLPHPLGRDGFDSFWWTVKPSRAHVIDAIENLLDPAHPHFLHPGIVRSAAARHPVDVTVRIHADHAEAVYVENSQTSALIPRLLEGFRVTSAGRFFPPAIGQLTFEGPRGLKLAITVFFTPETQSLVRPFAHFATPRGRIPALVKEFLLRSFHKRVLAQDQTALREQSDNIERFGAPKFAFGPLDFLLPAIRCLAAGEKPVESERKLTVML